MIAYLIKNWKLLLDIVIVVAGIIVFTLLDPFGMFSKRNLRSTANLVSSVKDIGELVTSEYYGEVISSLNETFIFDLPEDTVTEKFEESLYQLKLECNNAIDNNENLKQFLRSSELNAIRTEFNQTNEYIYNHLIVLMAVNMIEPDEDKFYIENNQTLQGKTEQRVIKRIYNHIEAIHKKYKKDKITEEERDTEINSYINEIPVYIESSAHFHYHLNNMALSKYERKRDIVFIGRGWVKAGYKFEKLDERNFAYDENNKLIRFYGLSPIVLDTDINPWFIPENKIKGFELVDFYRGATFEEAKVVKKRCKEKLLEQAYNAGIMKQAQKNGEEALRNFFSLLLDEPDLKVKFQPLPYQNELNLIKSDTLITVNEALKINTILNQFKARIKRSESPDKEILQQQLSIFYDQLTEIPFVDTAHYFNIYSTEAAKILDKKYFIVKTDYDNFINIRDSLQISKDLDTIFTNYTDTNLLTLHYPDFISHFNNTLKLLDSQLESAISDTSVTVEITKQLIDSLGIKTDDENGIKLKISDKIVGKDTVYILTRDSNKLPYRFYDLSYPELTIPHKFEDTLKLSQLGSIESFIDQRIKIIDYTTGNSEIDSIRKYEVENIIKTYENNRIEQQVSLKPIHKFIDFVKRPIN